MTCLVNGLGCVLGWLTGVTAIDANVVEVEASLLELLNLLEFLRENRVKFSLVIHEHLNVVLLRSLLHLDQV